MSARATIGKKSLLSVIFLQLKEDLDCAHDFTPCNRLHDLILSHFTAELGHLLPVAHHNDAVAGAQYFLQLGGNEHARFAFFGQRKYQFLNFGLCPHIDAAGGLIQDQKPWVRGEPTRQDHLLLVAAA